MAGPDLAELEARLRSPERFAQDPFGLLREIARALALAGVDESLREEDSVRRARELVIRASEHRELMGDARQLHDSLLARIGLFPYLDEAVLTGTNLFAYEAHRPLHDFGTPIVWHRAQAEVYAQLMDGRNVILSAPTSFGKSKIIDGLVASGRYRNIVVIVPTIALIDEARRRLTRIAREYKVVSHVGQATGEKNILVLTQERLLEFDAELPAPDLFVIDEFYKLSMEEDSDRARLLNQAFYRMLKTGAQFYLLGPNIGGIDPDALAQLDCVWIDSHDTTVAVDVTVVPRRGDEKERVLSVCSELTEPTLVYCSSPDRTERVALWLAEAGLGKAAGSALDAATWLRKHYHPQWRLAQALENGVGVHHGRLPRSLAHYVVRAFDEQHIQFLVCTSTLIEGVNTKAKNIVVVDNKIGRPRRVIDLFTFNNIKGRTGRMGQHVTGRVFLFNTPPGDQLLPIDIPVLSQPDNAPPDLLLGVEERDLQPEALERLNDMLRDASVERDVLQASPAVSMEHQLALVRGIESLTHFEAAQLSWTTPYPSWDNRMAVFRLVWEEVFGGLKRHQFGVGSPQQLLKWLDRAAGGVDTRKVVDEQVAFNPKRSVNETILDVLQFQRQGLTFAVPKWLLVVDRLQRELLPRRGLRPGDYSAYAARVENLFMKPPLGALDEYGVPPELAQRLEHVLIRGDDDLDAVLGRLTALDPDALGLEPFERWLLREAQRDLPDPTLLGDVPRA